VPFYTVGRRLSRYFSDLAELLDCVDRKDLRMLNGAGLLRILFADAAIVVVSKPSGLLCVPGRTQAADAVSMTRHWLLDNLPKGPPPCAMFASHSGFASPAGHGFYSGLRAAHRLDMQTSGVVAFAASGPAHSLLSHMLYQDKPLRLRGGGFPPRIQKRYVALCDARLAYKCAYPVTEQDFGVCHTPLQSHSHLPLLSEPETSELQSSPARKCETRWRILQRYPRGLIRVEFEPVTGRTHQLRLHAALPPPLGLGCPVIGDAMYGDPALAARPYLEELVERYRSVSAPSGSIASHLLEQQRTRFAMLESPGELVLEPSRELELPSTTMLLHAQELIIPDWKPPPRKVAFSDKSGAVSYTPARTDLAVSDTTTPDQQRWSIVDAREGGEGVSVERVQLFGGDISAPAVDAVRFFHAAPF
jgi:23S rRNA-/tRNA-specific pseudouridylate synthase